MAVLFYVCKNLAGLLSLSFFFQYHTFTNSLNNNLSEFFPQKPPKKKMAKRPSSEFKVSKTNKK